MAYHNDADGAMNAARLLSAFERSVLVKNHLYFYDRQALLPAQILIRTNLEAIYITELVVAHYGLH